ncbi:MAG: hypothetical protein ACK53L_18665 [Pirellulaceae bacterium]
MRPGAAAGIGERRRFGLASRRAGAKPLHGAGWMVVLAVSWLGLHKILRGKLNSDVQGNQWLAICWSQHESLRAVQLHY